MIMILYLIILLLTYCCYILTYHQKIMHTHKHMRTEEKKPLLIIIIKDFLRESKHALSVQTNTLFYKMLNLYKSLWESFRLFTCALGGF